MSALRMRVAAGDDVAGQMADAGHSREFRRHASEVELQIVDVKLIGTHQQYDAIDAHTIEPS
jgi:hypothetical protein